MKIRLDALPQQLKTLAACYWITGDEPVLRDEAFETIRQAAHQQGFTDKSTFHVLDTFDWEYFFQCLRTQSLFNEKQLVVLKLWHIKLNATIQQNLLDYVNAPNPSKLFVILSARLTPQLRQQKWFQRFEKRAIIVQIWPLSLAQQRRWLMRQLKQAGFSMDQSTFKWLNTQIEGNLLAAQQILEKLKLVQSPGFINQSTLHQIVTEHQSFDVFALSEAILQQQNARILTILNILKQQNTEPLLVLWAICKEIRLLYQIAQQQSQGESLETLMQRHQIWRSRQSLIKHAISNTSLNQLQNSLTYASYIDQAYKTQPTAPIWQMLTQLACRVVSQ